MPTICTELQQILEQYNHHKEQTTQQLEDAIRAQLEQQVARKGGQVNKGSINPAMHPQYKEEVARMLSDLNAQYNQALDQRKEMIRQYMAQALLEIAFLLHSPPSSLQIFS